MNRFPAGVTLLPQFITVADTDLWDETNAAEVRLKSGQVMLRSEKVVSIGQAMGIKLRKVREDREVTVGKEAHLEAAWVASMNLPDGTVIETSVVTKKLPMFTSHGKLQAHLSENLERKVKRNAIKELLSIPTAMPREQAKKVWVCVKAVFDPNSENGKNRLKEIEGSASVAEELLFDAVPEILPAPVFDPTEARKKGEMFGKKIQSAKNMDELRSIKAEMREEDYDGFSWTTLINIFNKRYAELKDVRDPKL
ncbi:hypothetical protein LEP1GSC158_0645 [Leptospira interrogans serovar Zanoni str. LT2156]|uniref:Uncharacterized protein n=2 Tax=Leptospira interrogans TaxID=173 RepID=M6HAH5_LEPIR|nr:hypothetical protein LEP1GSC158_0645 [Leptospira interrogans serovar Zanoni str. LT2156]